MKFLLYTPRTPRSRHIPHMRSRKPRLATIPPEFLQERTICCRISFIRQCAEYVDPAFGFAIGINFWFAVRMASSASH